VFFIYSNTAIEIDNSIEEDNIINSKDKNKLL